MAEKDILRVKGGIWKFVWRGEIRWRNLVLLKVRCHLRWGGFSWRLVKKYQFLWIWVSIWSRRLRLQHNLWASLKKCCSLQCEEFSVCSNRDLYVQERYLLGGVLKSEFDCGLGVVNEVIRNWKWLFSVYEGLEDLIYNFLPEEYSPDNCLFGYFFIEAYEEVGIQWGSFGPHSCAKSRRKWLFINDRLLGGELSGRKWESVHE